ncbi:zonular occludens toxin family protein, partial [Neisseria sp. P0001.S004]
TCISYIKDGLPFNPYKAKQPETAVTSATKEQPETPQVLTMGGESPQNLMYEGYNEKSLSNQGAKVGI